MLMLSIGISVFNLALGFGLAVFLHYCPDLDWASVQNPLAIRIAWRGRIPVPLIRFRTLFTPAWLAQVDAAENQWLEAISSPDRQDPAMNEAKSTAMEKNPYVLGTLVEVVDGLALDLLVFRRQLADVERQLRNRDQTLNRSELEELIQRFQSQQSTLVTKQLGISLALAQSVQPGESSAAVALEVADLMYDFASEIADSAARGWGAGNDTGDEVHLLQAEFQRLYYLTLGLSDLIPSWWSRLPDDVSRSDTVASTGLKNRVAYEREYSQYRMNVAGGAEEATCVLIDVDRLQPVCSRYDLFTCDGVVRTFAAALIDWSREHFGDSLLYQVGQASFLVQTTKSIPNSITGAESLRQSLEATTLQMPQDELVLSLSAAVVNACDADATSNLERLRKTLAVARKHGGNRVAVERDGTRSLHEPQQLRVESRVLQVSLPDEL